MVTERVAIVTASIELGAFLKWTQVVQSGGQAKALIQSGRVQVNGAPERRRSRTLVPGDRVEVGARTLEVVFPPNAPKPAASAKLPQSPAHRDHPRSRP
ncbi:MAG TPA: RNA-binding S4 domain-containing protein [bacterium]|nr:RNA-binding S4 domain-containing protein [bacterium]